MIRTRSSFWGLLAAALVLSGCASSGGLFASMGGQPAKDGPMVRPETPPEYDSADYDCPEGDCEYDQCMHISSRVWLAPFDFGIMQGVDMRFKPSPEEGGFLELHVDLSRESGEANAWHRINKTFLHHLRKQLLIWRSFDDATKKDYEDILIEAEVKLGLRQAPDK